MTARHVKHRRREIAIAIVVIIALIAIARYAHGQCGETPSSCWSCHETAGRRSVIGEAAPWHRDHAFADLCSRCHGGDPLASDERAAHAARVEPLASSVACASCHADDADAKLRAYVDQVPAAAAVSTLDSGGPPPPAPPPIAPNDPLLALALGALGVLGATVIVIVERRRVGAARVRLGAIARRAAWSPYAAGALLGVVVTISLAVFGRRLSGAGGYQSLSGLVGRAVAPDAPYWTSIVRTGMTWDVWLLLGTFAGAFASAAASRQLCLRTMPDARWIQAFGPRVALRWGLVFIGTALLSIAAGIAGGCTASLVLSGGAALAPGAYVFMAAMFAGGIPVARFVEWRARRGAL
ncbi:MAG: YeeE/YedE family protein [Deltaproteobacteria bacterium]|nr:YeeE/YedE family protein [Deltaproteobacteria bacterium]